MRKLREVLILVLVGLLIASIPMTGFALEDEIEEQDDSANTEVIEEEDDQDADELDDEDDADEEKDNGKGKGKGKGKDKEEKGNKEEKDKAWVEYKDELEANKDAVEDEKDQIEAEKDALEEQYEAAKDSGDLELAEQLKAQLEEFKLQVEAKKQEMKDVKAQMKDVIKNKYTAEELELLRQAAEELEASDPSVTAVAVENILIEDADVTFDTPPVIKGGRTLIPVRAITEGMGAEVDWNPDTREVTVTLNDTVILLPIDSNVVYVNGEEVQLDTKSEIMNNRTYVPLRFIAETFGLKVDWDSESGTIEIGDETEEEVVEEGGEVVEETDGTTEEGTEEATDEEIVDATDEVVEDTTDETADETDGQATEEDTTEETAATEDTTDETTEETTTETVTE